MSPVSSAPITEHTVAPLISVVTVCLNADAHIRAAMESVQAQTYSSVEHVVVDGASTDGTMAIVREFATQFGPRVRFISEPDEGLYDAMNKGIAMAEGTLIGTLNADDYYEADALERVAKAWRAQPRTGVFYGDLRTVDSRGVRRILGVPDAISLSQMRRSMVLHHPATFVSESAYQAIGGYDIRYRIAADYDLLVRAVEAGLPFTRVPGVLTNFSLAGVSSTGVRETDRETTLVRIAHGVNPIAAWARFYKSAVASSVYGTFERNPLFRRTYDRYKGIR